MDDEFKFLKEQKKLLDDAMAFFSNIERLGQTKDNELWESLETMVREIDTKGIQLSVEILLTSTSSKRLHRFLYSNLYNSDFYEKLKNIHKEDFEIYKSDFIKDHAPMIVEEFRSTIYSINDIVMNTHEFRLPYEYREETYQPSKYAVFNRLTKYHPQEEENEVYQSDQLRGWIDSDYISDYIEIEKELLSKGYINSDYKWQKHKIELAEFLCVIISFKYFSPIVEGKRIKDFHKRRFIEQRYGYKENGLSQTWKKVKNNIETAKITFSWITKPK